MASTSSGNGDLLDQLKVCLKEEEIDDLKKQKVSMLEIKVLWILFHLFHTNVII